MKFKCWDEENQKMWPYAVPLFPTEFNASRINVSENPDGSNNHFVNGVLLPCSELLDKNEKPFCVGDIAKIKWYEKDIYLEIKFESLTGFYADGLMDYFQNNYSDFEIVGNIYQNPELLKEE